MGSCSPLLGEGQATALTGTAISSPPFGVGSGVGSGQTCTQTRHVRTLVWVNVGA